MEMIAITVFFALVVGWIEFKSYRYEQRHKQSEADIIKVVDNVSGIFNCISALHKNQVEMMKSLEAQSEFINKASTDLQTIVNEYEVNGIPLGYDRGKKFDMVEGL
jgi:hypothetical protein